MNASIIEVNENGVIWASVDGVTYGLSEDGTLMECDENGNCDNCNNIDSESVAKNEEIKELILKLND